MGTLTYFAPQTSAIDLADLEPQLSSLNGEDLPVACRSLDPQGLTLGVSLDNCQFMVILLLRANTRKKLWSHYSCCALDNALFLISGPYPGREREVMTTMEVLLDISDHPKMNMAIWGVRCLC